MPTSRLPTAASSRWEGTLANRVLRLLGGIASVPVQGGTVQLLPDVRVVSAHHGGGAEDQAHLAWRA